MKVTQIVMAGDLPYTHHYMQTTTGEETMEHTISAPPHLVSIAADHTDAEVVVFGDDSLGIEIGGKLWAAEDPNGEMRPAKKLPNEVWKYCNLAMGRNGDSYART